MNTETDERVAIKVLDKEKIQKQNMGAQIKKEISIMKMVRHRHVVVLKEVLASRTKIFIVLELITGGELFDKIVSEGRHVVQAWVLAVGARDGAGFTWLTHLVIFCC